MRRPYPSRYYARCVGGSRSSAEVIAPIIVRLLAPDSVVDVGCGVGTWLAAFLKQGVQRGQGVDGDYVRRDELKISPELFRPHDLTQPIDLGKFDLAISLEVAEHLPPDRARGFVADLTDAAPAVLFSAAIPYQGGNGHVNERWADYWIELFGERGYEAVDCVRPEIWEDEHVEPWYAQNIFLFVSDHGRGRWPHLSNGPPSFTGAVHPRLWLKDHEDPTHIRQLVAELPASARNALKQRLRARRSELRKR